MYVLQEMQTTGGATALVQAQTYDDEKQALRAFYLACAAAVISDIEVHTIKLFDSYGKDVEVKVFEHLTQPAMVSPQMASNFTSDVTVPDVAVPEEATTPSGTPDSDEGDGENNSEPVG